MNVAEFLVTFDGLAASGKSTCSRLLAAELGWPLLSTGEAHRLNVWLMLARGVDPTDDREVAEYLAKLRMTFEEDNGRLRPVMNGLRPDPSLIQSSTVSRHLPTVTALPAVCRALAEQFRIAVLGCRVVAEGHGLGTGIFPGADVKFYCDAPIEVRVRRRSAQVVAAQTLDEVRAELMRRDKSDQNRPVNPVRRTADMVFLDTDRLSPHECLAQARTVVHSTLASRSAP